MKHLSSTVAPGSARSLAPPLTRGSQHHGMSLVEMIVVIGVIALLVAILLPGLAAVRKNAIFAQSQSNLRQIHTFLTTYGMDNRDSIAPAAFDYSAQAGDPRVVVRTPSPAGVNPPIGDPLKGSWSDVLWTSSKSGPLNPSGDAGSYDYRYDSPDRAFYDIDPDEGSNVFRSKAKLTKTVDGTGAFPFGTGTEKSEIGQPGYFAANHFFDLTTNGGKWYTLGQIIRPSQSAYLVDSYGGEVTSMTGSTVDAYQLQYVDFRYPGDVACILMFDGHVETQPEWDTLRNLEETRQIRFLNLDKQKSFY